MGLFRHAPLQPGGPPRGSNVTAPPRPITASSIGSWSLRVAASVAPHDEDPITLRLPVRASVAPRAPRPAPVSQTLVGPGYRVNGEMLAVSTLRSQNVMLVSAVAAPDEAPDTVRDAEGPAFAESGPPRTPPNAPARCTAAGPMPPVPPPLLAPRDKRSQPRTLSVVVILLTILASVAGLQPRPWLRGALARARGSVTEVTQTLIPIVTGR